MIPDKTILFDFDGTILDSLDLALTFGNQNQSRFSKTTITKEEFRNLSMREALAHMGLPWHRLPGFVFELKAFMNEHLQEASVFPEIPSLIVGLKNQGFRLVIVSSNSRENIEGVLSRDGLLNYFEEIVSDSSIFGKHVVLKQLMKRRNMNRAHAVYIGDEVRDAEAAAECGVGMIAVGWGWDSVERLKKVPNLVIAQSVTELSALIEATKHRLCSGEAT